MTKITGTSALSLLACNEGLDTIQDRLRAKIRCIIEAVFNDELRCILGCLRYGREAEAAKVHRHGSQDHHINGTFGTKTTTAPHARIVDAEGKIIWWRSKALPRYQRLEKRPKWKRANTALDAPRIWSDPDAKSRRVGNTHAANRANNL